MMDLDLSLRLASLDDRVSTAVDKFRSVDLNPTDPFRGLYVSDEQADQLIYGEQRRLPEEFGEQSVLLPDSDTVLGRLAARFDLNPLDLDLLVAALAPDVDPRFERLFGYLHDDLTRKRASTGLALELSGRSPIDAPARLRFGMDAPLVAGRLIIVEEWERPFLTRSVRVPDRVIAHLLGDDSPDPSLTEVLVPAGTPWGEHVSGVARAVDSPARLYLREQLDAGASGIAAAGLRLAGCSDAFVIDLGRVHPDDVRDVARDAIRECRLTDQGLVCMNTDALNPAIIRILSSAPIRVVMVGAKPWDPMWADRAVHTLRIDPPPEHEQRRLWDLSLASQDVSGVKSPPAFRLGPDRIRRAVDAAQAAAAEQDIVLTAEHLISGAQAQNSVGLSKLARRVEPQADWNDIVLDPLTRHQLEHLTSRVAHRHLVLDEWGLRRGGNRGEGVIAMFAGNSGTGKTMAAEIIASDLGLEMYVIDLSTVVDKYIGETEKNLERIFTEAEGVNGILFFDEADALFGKRTDVSDSKDRYANVEVAYLLQRLESFDGLGILATNLRANIDDAFARRLSVVIEFPEPDERQRVALWEELTGVAPLDGDVDLAFCASAFKLTGGNIRNAVVSAAYLAASNQTVIHMSDLVQAIEIEYRKLGRLCTEAEFGKYHTLLHPFQELR